MLDRLTVTDFEPAVGDTFSLDAEDAGRMDVELVEARLLQPTAPARDASGWRAPFTLTFRGPAEPLLPQRIYRFEHESLPAIEIFIVPLRQGPDGTVYEAVFA